MESFPETRDEEFVTVRYDFVGKAILTVPMIEEDTRKLRSINIKSSGYHTQVRIKSVSHGDNAVEPIIKR